MELEGSYVLITGSARRLGREMALAVARAGGHVIIHHGHSPQDALSLKAEIEALGRKGYIIQADFSSIAGVEQLIEQAFDIAEIRVLVNNAAIFQDLTWQETSLEHWQNHFQINLTAPFLLSQAFTVHLPPDSQGRIVNILDWRALRPQGDHFPYTITKAALAAMTRSLAVSLAPRITVNGLALGAILPPSSGEAKEDHILQHVPAQRWADIKELNQALLFLLTGPAYITGEIIHVDGGRHLI